MLQFFVHPFLHYREWFQRVDREHMFVHLRWKRSYRAEKKKKKKNEKSEKKFIFWKKEF